MAGGVGTVTTQPGRGHTLVGPRASRAQPRRDLGHARLADRFARRLAPSRDSRGSAPQALRTEPPRRFRPAGCRGPARPAAAPRRKAPRNHLAGAPSLVAQPDPRAEQPVLIRSAYGPGASASFALVRPRCISCTHLPFFRLAAAARAELSPAALGHFRPLALRGGRPAFLAPYPAALAHGAAAFGARTRQPLAGPVPLGRRAPQEQYAGPLRDR